MDRGVLQPLPCEPPEGETVPDPSNETLCRRPETLAEDPLTHRTLHVDAVPHSQSVGRADPILHAPPSDEMSQLPGFESVENVLGLELAVPG